MKPITKKNLCTAHSVRSARARRAAALALSAALLAGGAAWADRAASLSGNTLTVTDGTGGAAWSADQIVELSLDQPITGNVASSDQKNVTGGALYAWGMNNGNNPGHITLSGEEVVVQSNRAVSTLGSAFGGAMFAFTGDITLTGGSITVQSNDATGGGDAWGGALRASAATISDQDTDTKEILYGAVTLSADGDVTVSGNTASAAGESASATGGAVKAAGALIVRGANVTIDGNTASGAGSYSRAYGGVADAGSIDIAAAKELTLTSNTASALSLAQGGALYSGNGVLSLSADTVTVSDNAASADRTAYGGAVYALKAAVSVRGAGVTIDGNAAKGGQNASGGAIYGGDSVTVEAAGDVTLTNNMAQAGSEAVKNDSGYYSYYEAYGGAVYALNAVSVSGASVMIDGNTASGYRAEGGAVYSHGAVTLTAEGGVTVTDNHATATGTVPEDDDEPDMPTAYGGAMEAEGSITLSGSAVTVQSNDAISAANAAFGGALYASFFEGNEDDEDGHTMLPGVAVLSADGELNVTGNRAESKGTSALQAGEDEEGFLPDAAAAGGAVFVTGDAALSGSAVTVADNAAVGSSGAALGGAVYAGPTIEGTEESMTLRGGTITLTGASIDVRGNKAESASGDAKGGALHAAGLPEFSGGDNEGGEIPFALGDAGSVTLSGDEITLAGNTAKGTTAAQGGAIWSGGDVTITAGTLTFDGNSAVHTEAIGTAQGGAVWASGDISLTANDIFVNQDTEANDSKKAVNTFWSENGNITLTGNLTPHPGTIFSAPKGDVTMQGGVLSLTAVPHDESTPQSQLAAFAGTNVSLKYDDLSLTGAITPGDECDVALVGYAADGGKLEFNAPKNPRYTVTSTDYDSELDGELRFLTDGYAVNKLTVAVGSADLVWKAGSADWTIDSIDGDGAENEKRWVHRSAADVEDWFYNGDAVTFTEKNAGTVTVPVGVSPAAMTVTGGEYTFTGDGDLDVTGDLNVTGGSALFAKEISAQNATLTGKETKLTLEQALTVTGAFVQSGGTLIVNVGKLQKAALLGSGSATLTIDSGALKLLGDKATVEGNTYTIASGFDVKSVWADENVSGEAAGTNVKYAVKTADKDVNVVVTCDEEKQEEGGNKGENEGGNKGENEGGNKGENEGGNKGENEGGNTEPENRRVPFILTAGQSLRNAANVGTQGQMRAFGLLNAPANIMSFANGFMPMEQGKVGGVWASTWYSHARVDNATADMKFKNYGVTIGTDKQFGTGVAGLAVNLGKTEGRGRGKFDGSDSDGKHIGVSLYGAKAIARGNVTLTGDIGYNWHRDDYDSTTGGDYYSARRGKSRVFTVGGTAWFNASRPGARVNIKPFVGVRYSHFSMDDLSVKKNGADWSTIGGESVSQWTVPLGVKFDWTPMTTKKGWKIKPSVELAYVYAGGDRAMNVRETVLSGGSATRSTQMLTDKSNFRASLGLDAKRNNLTLGLGVNALLSSGQKDVAVNATLRWDL